jgi:hypothetical protein
LAGLITSGKVVAGLLELSNLREFSNLSLGELSNLRHRHGRGR